jgi:hypothetical protein
VDEQERALLVNTRIEAPLMAVVLDFLYRPENSDSVPPMLQLGAPLQAAAAVAAAAAAVADGALGEQEHGSGGMGGGVVTLEHVVALLDGATPLHCACLRGNPAQVGVAAAPLSALPCACLRGSTAQVRAVAVWQLAGGAVAWCIGLQATGHQAAATASEELRPWACRWTTCCTAAPTLRCSQLPGSFPLSSSPCVASACRAGASCACADA